MSPHIIAALLIAWAVWGVVLGWRRTDIVTASVSGWIALGVLWAACGPLAALLPRS